MHPWNPHRFILLAIVAWFVFILYGTASAGFYLGENFDDNNLNTNLWTITQYDGVSVAETNQNLEITIPGTASGNPFWGAISSYDPANNPYWFFIKEGSTFSIDVNFDLLQWPSPANGIRVALQLFIEVDPQNNKWRSFKMARISDPGDIDTSDEEFCKSNPNDARCTGDVYLAELNGWEFSNWMSDVIGRLRIKRSRLPSGQSRIAVGWYDLGISSWHMYSQDNADWGRVIVQLVAWGHDWKHKNEDAKVAFDNLKISSEKGFIYAPGDLQVVIKPQKAIDAKAQWNVDGGDWQPSGATVSDLAVRSGEKPLVSFKDINGWKKPEDREVLIVSNKVKVITATYVQQGALKVTIGPPEAVSAGAQWRVDGGAWQVSGVKVYLDVGDHTVEFKDILGWTEAYGRTVAIEAGKTKWVKGLYVKN